MSRIQTGEMDFSNPETGQSVTCWLSDASEKSIETVLDAAEWNDNGRSQFVWVRFPNGDLMLGVFPQGETYFATEEDHSGGR